MKFEEVKDAFMKGALIKRKDWDRFLVYIPGDSLSLECIVADDWELVGQSRNHRIDSIIAELQRLKD